MTDEASNSAGASDNGMRRVLVLANNLSQASFRVRIAALIDLLADRGFQLDVQLRPRGVMARRRLLRSAGNYHAVLLQRKLLDPWEARLLRREARRILYDIDDAVMRPQKPLGPLARWQLGRRFDATARAVDQVAAGNAFLADIFRERGRAVTVVPTVVDPARYAVKVAAQTSALRLVWIGSRSTLPYLRGFQSSLERAAAAIAGLGLITVADETLEHSTIPLEHIPWSADTESASLLRGDIGIAPTPSDPWTIGKCGFKIVQYMAAGLPVIASPVGANATLVEAGVTGLLPPTPEDWPAAIATLANDTALRARMGAAGRERVESTYCLRNVADIWARLLAE